MIEKAASAFQDTTGIDPVSLSVSDTGSTIKRVGKKIVNYNAFYMFFPIGLVLFIGIWLMMAFGWFDWAVAIYLSMLLIIILYVCDVLYRINAQDAIDKAVDEDLPTSSSDTLSSQQNMKTFISYIPQLVHAFGSAFSST